MKQLVTPQKHLRVASFPVIISCGPLCWCRLICGERVTRKRSIGYLVDPPIAEGHWKSTDT